MSDHKFYSPICRNKKNFGGILLQLDVDFTCDIFSIANLHAIVNIVTIIVYK